jgi:hypothetical protein
MSERTNSLSRNRLSCVMRKAAADLPPDGLRSMQRDRLSMKLQEEGERAQEGGKQWKTKVRRKRRNIGRAEKLTVPRKDRKIASTSQNDERRKR